MKVGEIRENKELMKEIEELKDLFYRNIHYEERSNLYNHLKEKYNDEEFRVIEYLFFETTLALRFNLSQKMDLRDKKEIINNLNLNNKAILKDLMFIVHTKDEELNLTEKEIDLLWQIKENTNKNKKLLRDLRRL